MAIYAISDELMEAQSGLREARRLEAEAAEAMRRVQMLLMRLIEPEVTAA